MGVRNSLYKSDNYSVITKKSPKKPAEAPSKEGKFMVNALKWVLEKPFSTKCWITINSAFQGNGIILNYDPSSCQVALGDVYIKMNRFD